MYTINISSVHMSGIFIFYIVRRTITCPRTTLGFINRIKGATKVEPIGFKIDFHPDQNRCTC